MNATDQIAEQYAQGQEVPVLISDLYQCLVNGHKEGFNRSFATEPEIKPYLKKALASFFKRAQFTRREQTLYLSSSWMSNKAVVTFLGFHHHKSFQPCERHVRVWITIQDGLFVDLREDDWDALVRASQTGTQAFSNSERKGD